MQPDAQPAAGVVVQPQVDQRLARVVEGLAAGDDAEAVVGRGNHVVVEPVGAHIGQRRIPFVVVEALFLVQRGIRPADVHTTGRHLELGHHDLHPLGVDDRRGAGLDNLLDRLHAGPNPAEAAHGKGVQAQVQDLLHRGRKEHRQAAGLEDVVALVRRGRALGHVVVPGHRDHPAPGRGAGHVGVLEHVRATVHPRALAVPDAEHPVEAVRTLGRKTQLLRAPQRGRRQLFVHPRLEHDVLLLQVGRGLLQRLVVTTQRRPPVTADKSGRVLAQQRIALALQHGQLDQGLHPAHEGAPVVQRVLVIQRDGFQGLADVLGQRRVHVT